MVYVYIITKICSNTTYNQNINELNTPSTHDLEPTQIYDDHILTQLNPINTFQNKVKTWVNVGKKCRTERRFIQVLKKSS
jgi:hypothetical protein